MKTLMLILISPVVLSLSSKDIDCQEGIESATSHNIKVVDFEQLQPLLQKDHDTINVRLTFKK